MGILDRITRLFHPGKPAQKKAGSATPASLVKILHAIERTREQELPCDEACALVDQFAEMVQRGEDAVSLMPLVQHHLEFCTDCREEYEALLRILESLPA